MFSAANASFGGHHAGNACGDTQHHGIRNFLRQLQLVQADNDGHLFFLCQLAQMVSSSILPLMSKNDVGSSSMIISGCWQTRGPAERAGAGRR